jgi:hypothetical protein
VARTGVALVAVVVVAALAPAASSRSAAGAAEVKYRVVAATHMSSSRKTDLPLYTGSATSTWRLAAPTRKASNIVSIAVGGPVVLGSGRVNVRGTFTARATSNVPGRCSLSATTGSTKYPAVAPGPFQITVTADPASAQRVLVTLGPGGYVQATLGNPYFGSECGTRISGEPSPNQTTVKRLPKSAIGRNPLVLSYVGTSSRDGIAYRWNTAITLRRIAG